MHNKSALRAELCRACPDANPRAIDAIVNAVDLVERIGREADEWTAAIENAGSFCRLVEGAATSLQALSPQFETGAEAIFVNALALSDHVISTAKLVSEIERAPRTAVKEIRIVGGIAGADKRVASVEPAGIKITRQEGEKLSEFRSRARATAAKDEAEFLVFGGLDDE